MSKIQTFQVFPRIPEQLSFLGALSMNLWWTWRRDAIELFRRIDPQKWEESGRNPLVLLTKLSQDTLERITKDNSFLAHQKRVAEDFRHTVSTSVDPSQFAFKDNETIAYFSMEFGIHESLPLFAGGLGVLAGDHLKSASNVGLPMTGIGLLYRRGYFRQMLSPEGWQQEIYPEVDYYSLPVVRAQDPKGNSLRITVEGPDGSIHADVWRVNVGRIRLYLLDANIFDNPPEIREVTSRLYAGDAKMRLSQEVLLGIGGMRVLEALEIYPKVIHMNEGHCSFTALERLSQVISDYQVDIKTALEIVPRATVFTTHTPVAAGHDEFPIDLVRPVLRHLVDKLGVSMEEILSWGQSGGLHSKEPLSMFILGMRLSQHRNGVSKLHGQTARRMWSHVWPRRPLDEIPISHITNGIHIASFISPEFANLFDRYIGPDWHLSSRRQENIERIDNISNEELWKAHELNRARLISLCRHKLIRQYERQNAPRTLIEEAATVLDDDVLTIGFSRRFATYKRGDLLFKNLERLESILNHPDYPVQFIFAGKAHPRDNEGKEMIRRIIEFSHRPGIVKKIVFIEDYDMDLARYLVQGADAWLNTPRRPLEACGTSGMKASVNGVINISTLDGWWYEGYSEDVGWAIGGNEEFTDTNYQDFVESQALYKILEDDVIPCFYTGKNGGVSTQWLKKMRASIKMAMKNYCSMRMIAEYESRFYNFAARHHDALLANHAKEAKHLADRIRRYRTLWKQIRIEAPVRERSGMFRIGDSFSLSTMVYLGELTPEEVEIELYYGPFKQVEELNSGMTQSMMVSKYLGNGNYQYVCTMTCVDAGRFGFTVRATPRGDDRVKSTPGLITWA